MTRQKNFAVGGVRGQLLIANFSWTNSEMPNANMA